MKKFMIIFAIILLLPILIFSQSPQAFQYQAILRDAEGNILAEQEVNLQLSILYDTPQSDSVYTEEHLVNTNQYGLINLQVGSGNVLHGEFNMVDWGNHTTYLKVSIDTSGNANYSHLGTTQLLSVPYALYAESGGEWNPNGDDLFYNGGNVGIGINSPQNKLDVNGSINSNSTFKINNSDILKILPGYGTLSVGNFSGSQNSLSYYTTAVGQGAGYYSENSNYNTYVGSSTGFSANGSGNSILGTFAANQISGSNNTSVGFRSFGRMDLDTIIGDNNSMFGSLSGMNTVNASNNVYLGYQSGYANSNGNNNVFIGSNSGTQSSSSSSVFIGKDAGSLIIGDNLLFIENSNSTIPLIYGEFDNDILGFNGQVGIGTMDPGAYDLKVIGNSELNGDLDVNGSMNINGALKMTNSDILKTYGSSSLYLGFLNAENVIDNSFCTFIGHGAGRNITTNQFANTFLGNSAGYSANGVNNTYLGCFTSNFIDGNNNTSIGYAALGRTDNNINYGSNNTTIGFASGALVDNSNDNVYVGFRSGSLNLNGNNNVFLGSKSGYQSSASNSVFIGYESGLSITGDNLLYIENSNSSTPLIYGEFDNDILGFNGQVGIGTMDPGAYDLKVIGNSELNGDLDVTGIITGDGSGLTNLPGDADWTISGNDMYAGISGNVGIGYSAPASKLHLFSVDWDDHLIIERAGNPRGHISLGNNNMVFWVGSGSGLYINSDGNTGIGTTPNEKLQVDGGILLGNTINTNPGTIRWSGSDFEGYDGTSWLSLTSASQSPILKNEVDSLKQKVLLLQKEIENLKVKLVK